jgi:conjugal transfer pilus assembly protein TraV
MKNIYLIFFLLIVAITSGCSSLGIGEDDFACRGYPEGLRCMSSQDVYTLTDSDEYKERIAIVAASQGAEPERAINRLPGEGPILDVNLDPEAVNDNANNSAKVNNSVLMSNENLHTKSYIKSIVPQQTKGTIPLRTPAQVMRIYIAPWESISGDLNVPSYVYTEIEPRRWMIGNKPIKINNSLKPLQSIKKSTRSDNKTAGIKFPSQPLKSK